MRKIYAYFHAGSKNHGCEAIVRSTNDLLNKKMTLISFDSDADYTYELDKIVEIKANRGSSYSIIEKIGIKLSNLLLKNEKYSYHMLSKHEVDDYEKNGIALSIGGDNYCYGNAYNLHLEGLNKHLKAKGLKTVLWGCSIEPSDVTEGMKQDFAKYDLITARETISYNFLKKYNKNTVLICDPAFWLKKDESLLSSDFKEESVVGINVSPLIVKKETVSGITKENYIELIQYILKTTNYKVALIPHVVNEGNDDRTILKELYDQISDKSRIMLVDDCNCEQLKGYIANCRFFVGARTHATIAAYSSEIPTLVVGYSTKAIGIAKDLFGTDEKFVLPVQELKKSDDLVKGFEWLIKNELEIKNRLKSILPEYKRRINAGIDAINNLVEE